MSSSLDGFNDLLDEVRKQGDLLWITQKKAFTENVFKKKREPEQIKQDVLNSPRLKHVIDQLAKDEEKKKSQHPQAQTQAQQHTPTTSASASIEDVTTKKLFKEAKEILD